MKEELFFSNKDSLKLNLYQWRLDNNQKNKTSYFEIIGDSTIYQLNLDREMSRYKISKAFQLSINEIIFVFEKSSRRNGKLLLANFNMKSRKFKKLFQGQSPTLHNDGRSFDIEKVIYLKEQKIIHVKLNKNKSWLSRDKTRNYFSLNSFDFKNLKDYELMEIPISIDAVQGNFWIEEFEFNPRCNIFKFSDSILIH